MQKRKLQIFLSSTYEDLIDERLAAMEAILAAGHIPAAMEQFAPGDETALEKIKVWIEESDAFMLILGGRYGSIEPRSGKSYVQLEYEYAVEKKKPFFAIVVDEKHHEKRVKEFGLIVDERENQQKLKEFKTVVSQKVCGFWTDRKDIKVAVFQKLPEWAQRPELIGWVRANEAPSPEVMNELARLSSENRDLRAASAAADTFEGLTFDELVEFLSESDAEDDDVHYLSTYYDRPYYNLSRTDDKKPNLLQVFEDTFEEMAAGTLPSSLEFFVQLTSLASPTKKIRRESSYPLRWLDDSVIA